MKNVRPSGPSNTGQPSPADRPSVWKCLCRAVDKEGKTVDFFLAAYRDMAAARRRFAKAMRENGTPDKVTMDKRGANKAAIDAINAGRKVPIVVRQVMYLNNIVEQHHRAINRVTRPMLNLKSFRAAGNVPAGFELMHMIRKDQFVMDDGADMSLADQFYALLAGQIHVYSSFFTIPLTFVPNNATCKAISAYAASCHPHTIHSKLLSMNMQNPKIRRPGFFDPIK